MVYNQDEPYYTMKTMKTLLYSWKRVRNNTRMNIGSIINLYHSKQWNSTLIQLKLTNWRESSIKAFIRNLRLCYSLKYEFGIDIIELENLINQNKRCIIKHEY